jgi:hypothetical protein
MENVKYLIFIDNNIFFYHNWSMAERGFSIRHKRIAKSNVEGGL